MGDNAKIGSNAVVLSSVPADSTVVGVPAKEVLVQPDDCEKVYDNNFEAYGVSSPAIDPVEVRLNALIRKIQEQDQEIELLKRRLNHKDIDISEDFKSSPPPDNFSFKIRQSGKTILFLPEGSS